MRLNVALCCSQTLKYFATSKMSVLPMEGIPFRAEFLNSLETHRKGTRESMTMNSTVSLAQPYQSPHKSNFGFWLFCASWRSHEHLRYGVPCGQHHYRKNSFSDQTSRHFRVTWSGIMTAALNSANDTDQTNNAEGKSCPHKVSLSFASPLFSPSKGEERHAHL